MEQETIHDDGRIDKWGGNTVNYNRSVISQYAVGTCPRIRLQTTNEPRLSAQPWSSSFAVTSTHFFRPFLIICFKDIETKKEKGLKIVCLNFRGINCAIKAKKSFLRNFRNCLFSSFSSVKSRQWSQHPSSVEKRNVTAPKGYLYSLQVLSIHSIKSDFDFLT